MKIQNYHINKLVKPNRGFIWLGFAVLFGSITVAELVVASGATQANNLPSQSNPTTQQEQKLLVKHAYMFEPAPVSRSGAVYVTLTNPSKSNAVVITSIQTELAAHSMIHQVTENNSTFKMKPVNELSLDPNQSLELAPNGLHIMLMGLTSRPLANPFEMWLTFDDDSTQKIMVTIQPIELNQ